MEISNVMVYAALGAAVGAIFLSLYVFALERSIAWLAAGLNICVLVIHSLVYEMGLIPSVLISSFSLCLSIWIVRCRPVCQELSDSPKKIGSALTLFSLLSGMFVASVELAIISIPFSIVAAILPHIFQRYWSRYAVMVVVNTFGLIAFYSFVGDLGSN